MRDVLADLYGFRNILAHGQEIPLDPYRKPKDLVSIDGHCMNHETYYYSELMNESALFMLASALRSIFLEGAIDDVKDEGKWRIKMNLYEHRNKEARGSPVADRKRGR